MKINDMVSQSNDNSQPQNRDMPTIEPMERVLAREVWNSPRPIDPIQMDSERAQQVLL